MIQIHCNLCGFVPGRTGGAQVFLEGLLAALNKFEELEFTFFGSSKTEQWLTSFLGSAFSFREFCSPSPNLLNRFLAIQKLKRIPSEDQIIWSPLNQGVGTGHRIKEVLTIHDLIPLHYSRSNPTYKRSWKREWLFRTRWKKSMSVSRKASAVVTVSESNVEELQRAIGSESPKVYGVPNGIDEPKKIAASQRSWMYSGKPEILAVTSGSMPHKGFGTLEKVAEALPDFTFLVVGKHCTASRPNIKHTGRLSIEALNEIYQTSSALFFPSRIEGFGLPVIEALVFGTPVVATDIPVLREVGGPESCYFKLDDIEAATDHLRSVVSSRELAEKMSAKGKEHAVEFTWEAAADAYLSIFRQVSTSNQKSVS